MKQLDQRVFVMLAFSSFRTQHGQAISALAIWESSLDQTSKRVHDSQDIIFYCLRGAISKQTISYPIP